MRLVTFEGSGRPRLGALVDGEILDLRRFSRLRLAGVPARLPGSMAAYLAGDYEAQEETQQAVTVYRLSPEALRQDWREQGAVLPLDQARLLAPVPRPGKIICVALNYPGAGQAAPPPYPVLFLKPASGLVGSGRAVRIPPVAQDVACEAELVVVIGRVARRVPQALAQEYVAGYSMANDLGDRLLEKRTSQWTTGKLMDTFCPVGPALVTPDEVPDPGNLPICTWVNGALVQQGSTGDMFFSPPALISYLSHLATLEPGDLILTGSPKRVGDQPAPAIALHPGDHVALEIGNLGRLENLVEAEEQAW